MNPFSTIFKKRQAEPTGRKSFDLFALLDQLAASEEMSLTSDGFAKQGYRRNPDVYACVREIAMACAGIPWIAMRIDKKGEEEIIPQHPMLDLLNRPNPRMSGARFKESFVSYHLIHGTAYLWRIGPNPIRPPLELYVPRPSLIEPKGGATMGEIAGFTYKPTDKQSFNIDPELMLQLPMFHPESELYGLSPLEAAQLPVNIGNAGRKWNFNLIENSARPPGNFETEQNLTDEAFNRLKEQIAAHYSGPGNAGKPMLVEGGAKWKDNGLSPTDMDWHNGQIMSTRDICKVFNVPPELIGDSASKTYSNYNEARKALYHETVLPLMDWITDELNNWLAPLYPDDVVLGYDLSAIDALQEDRDKLVTRLASAWWMSLNERRREMGLPDVNGGDEILVPGNLVTLDTLMGGGLGVSEGDGL